MQRPWRVYLCMLRLAKHLRTTQKSCDWRRLFVPREQESSPGDKARWFYMLILCILMISKSPMSHEWGGRTHTNNVTLTQWLYGKPSPGSPYPDSKVFWGRRFSRKKIHQHRPQTAQVIFASPAQISLVSVYGLRNAKCSVFSPKHLEIDL